jgi:hypothetical protein
MLDFWPVLLDDRIDRHSVSSPNRGNRSRCISIAACVDRLQDEYLHVALGLIRGLPATLQRLLDTNGVVLSVCFIVLSIVLRKLLLYF